MHSANDTCACSDKSIHPLIYERQAVTSMDNMQIDKIYIPKLNNCIVHLTRGGF